jgi:hypothetical protein
MQQQHWYIRACDRNAIASYSQHKTGEYEEMEALIWAHCLGTILGRASQRTEALF